MSKRSYHFEIVIPAQAGIHHDICRDGVNLDARLRGHDGFAGGIDHV